MAIEFAVVVFGVFAGLQAQAWYEYRAERQAEREYVDRLTADFSTIRNELELCLSVYRRSIAAIGEIADAVDLYRAADVSPAASGGDIGNALIRATAGVAPPGRSATFVEMLSTGDLGLLRDNDLRQTLTAYDQQAEVNRETWRSLREIQDRYIAPLYENITLAVDPDAQPVTNVTAYDLDGLANDPRMQGMLNVLAGSKANNYELCTLQVKRVASVEAALGAGLR